MRRIGRYSIGVGGGVLVLATVGGSAWQEATQLAGAAVGVAAVSVTVKLTLAVVPDTVAFTV